MTGFKDLEKKHFDWIYKVLEPVKIFQSEALVFHVKMAVGAEPEVKASIAK